MAYFRYILDLFSVVASLVGQHRPVRLRVDFAAQAAQTARRQGRLGMAGLIDQTFK